MIKTALFHTAHATVPVMRSLITAAYGPVPMMNWVDDSILPMLTEDPSKLEYCFEKMLTYARYAEEQGAAFFLNACSSVGEFRDYAEGKLGIPVVRIDDAVSDEILRKRTSVTVLATLGTTLRPSCGVFLNKKPEFPLRSVLVEGAWEAGLSGDTRRQNELIAGAIEKALLESDAVFLAQASMAGAAAGFSGERKERIYTSPELCVASLAPFYGR